MEGAGNYKYYPGPFWVLREPKVGAILRWAARRAYFRESFIAVARVVVGNPISKAIAFLDMQFFPLRAAIFGLILLPGIVAAAPGNVVDLDQPTDLVYSSKTLVHFSIGSKPGEVGIKRLSGMGQFNGPIDIYLDWRDDLYVNDAVNNRILKFNSDGLFLGVILQYPSGFSVGRLTVDRRGREYVNVSTPQSRIPNEVWEVRGGAVAKKFKNQGAPKIELPVSAVTGTKISHAGPNAIEISYSLSATGKRREIGFKSKKTISNFEVVLWATNYVLVRCFVGGRQFLYMAPLDGSAGKLILHPDNLFSPEGSWRISDFSSKGRYFAIHYDEEKERGSEDFSAQLIVADPVSKHE